MRTDLLDYHLPPELIAARPPIARDGGRMLAVEEDGTRHGQVADFASEVGPDDLLVLNETRVRRARLLCRRPSGQRGEGGARVELLFLHPLEGSSWSALGKANRPLRPGDRLSAGEIHMKIVSRDSDGTLVVDIAGDLEEALMQLGSMPIPPYMERRADSDDVERYQTVFASELGSAAAPTAGLHLTEGMLSNIQSQGTDIARLILHVGVGTFRPVSVADLDEHPMHSEELEVSERVVEQIAATRKRGGRVIAVGTTAVRALESARDPKTIGLARATRSSTNLLIQPGYSFGVVDALLTNFHQPRSTLLALVAAFVGLERITEAYREAVAKKYRFLSYGDAMWIPRACPRSLR